MEAEDVKRIRAKFHLTQSDLARCLSEIDGKKVSKRTVENWEQGTRGVGEENAEKLRKLEKE